MTTYITKEVIDEIRKTTPVVFGPIGEDVYRRTYSRTMRDGSQEDWYETAARVVNGNLNYVPEHFIEKEEAEKLFKLIVKMELIPAGRHLWATGIGRDFLNNCFSASYTLDFSEHFKFTFMRLMEGGGVGANYSSLFVNSRDGSKPWSPKSSINLHIICHPSHLDYKNKVQLDINETYENIPLDENNQTDFINFLSTKYNYDWDPIVSNGEGAIYLRVDDSREGWAETLVTLLDNHIKDNNDRDIVVDISNIRPRGAILKGFGGKASGPDALMLLLLRTNTLLNKKKDQNLSGLDNMLLDHYIAQAVVSGGVRRSARMSMKYWKDTDIFEFINSKQTKPGEVPNHWTTNISVVIDKKFINALKRSDEHAEAVYDAILEGMLSNGEPGFINASKCLEGESPGTEFYSSNPCGEIAMVEYPDMPCFDVCCLGHCNLDRVENPEEAFRLISRFLIRATFAPVTDKRQRANVDRNRRIGVGVLGYHSWLVKNKIKYSDAPNNETIKEFFRKMKRVIDEEVRSYCSKLRIPECIKKTTIAPTGCQRPDTLIQTNEGLFRLDELVDLDGDQWQNLDLLVAQEGKYEKATKGFVNGMANTKLITLKSGVELEATLNHQYRVVRNGHYQWVSVDNLNKGDIIPTKIGNTYIKLPSLVVLKETSFIHPRSNGVQPRKINQPKVLDCDMAWFIGLFHGDGSVHSNGIRISCHEDDLGTINRLEYFCKNFLDITIHKLKDPRERCVNVYINSVILLHYLEENGLLKSKALDISVPKAIRLSPPHVIKEFIEGLWTADGSNSGNTKYIDTISKTLAQELVILMRLIGQNASIKKYSDRSKSIGDNILYRVYYVGYGSQDFTEERYVSKSWREDSQEVKNLVGKDFIADYIEEIEDSSSMTLDLSVPINNCYMANGVVSHNSIGNLAGCTTGCQSVFSKFYIRRMRLSNTDDLLTDLKSQGYKIEKDKYAANTSIVEYYCIDPIYDQVVSILKKECIALGCTEEESKKFSERDAVDLIEDQSELTLDDVLATQRMLQKEFVDNAISITANIDSSKLTKEDLKSTLKHYLPDLKGLTIFPEFSMPQMPLERLTWEELEAKVAEGNKVERSQTEMTCSSGSCPIK